MPAAIIGAGIAAAGSVAGGVISSNAQKKAANKVAAAQQDATTQNNALAREQYAANKATLDPYINRGNVAGDSYNALLGMGGDTGAANNAFRQFIDNSDYAFNENQGERGLAARLSAAGGVESGAAQKALQSFRTNLQRGYRNDFLGMLDGQQRVGLTGASALAGVGQNMVSNVTQNNQQNANALSNSALLRANGSATLGASIASGLGTIGGAAFNPFGGGFGGSFSGGSGGNALYGGQYKSPTWYGRPTQYGSWI